MGSLLVASAADAGTTTVTRAEVFAFQAAGDVGGGVLTPGDTFPPSKPAFARLKRKADRLDLDIRTSGLPAGAYTVWWIIFNNPAGCTHGCGDDDFFNPDAQVSVFWAAGGVVATNGIGRFDATYNVGDSLGTPGTQVILDAGVIDPLVAEVHNLIKYHGSASSDPDTLYEQTHTILGSCEVGANALILPAPFGLNCFDPQGVIFPLP